MSRLAPTRSNLTALKGRLERVSRGAALLRRKREVLVAELFRIARPALDAREQIAADARTAWDGLHAALAVHGEDGLYPLGLPTREVPLDVEARVVWGVEVPALGAPPFVARSLAVRNLDPNTPGPAADEATGDFERLVEALIAAAPREILLERLAAHLARTTQQVNTLEQRLGPSLNTEAKAMARVLEEREREEHVRLRHLLRKRRR